MKSASDPLVLLIAAWALVPFGVTLASDAGDIAEPPLAVGEAHEQDPGASSDEPSETLPSSGESTPGSEMILFQEIVPVLGASKYEQNPIEAPSSITVITAEEIRTLGYRTLADVLRSVRGFFITYDRNYNYAGVRGFCRPGDYNTRIALLVDGYRVNDNIYDSASIGTEFILDLEVVDRIEIVRGPTSSLYGTNAFFGAVNVLTKRGRNLKGLGLSTSGASFGTWSGSASYGNRIGDAIDFLISTTAYRRKGQSLHFPEFDGKSTSGGWTGRIDDDETQKAFLKMSRSDFTVEAAYSSRRKGVPTASFGTDFNSSAEETTDNIGFLAFSYDHLFPSKRQLDGRLSYNYYSYWGDYPYSGVINRDVSDGKGFGLEGSTVQPIGKLHKLVLGGEYRDNFQQKQQNFDVDPHHVYLDSREDSRIWAVFAQDEVRLGDSFIVNAGARYDNYDSFGGTTNPRLAFIWLTRNGTALKVLLGRAFRAPNAYEVFYGTASAQQKGNPELRPEAIRSGEVVLESGLGRLRATAAVYHYDVRDLITLALDPSDGFLQYENHGDVRASGLELSLQGSLAKRLDGRLNYGIQESRDDATDERLTNSPRHVANVALSGMILSDRLVCSLEGNYTSSVRAVSGAMTGSSMTLNAGLRALWRPKLEVGVWISNLTDERYFYSAGEEHVQRLIEQDGRGYRMNVRYEF